MAGDQRDTNADSAAESSKSGARTPPNMQNFLFVDSSTAEDRPYKGRRSVRSFVMQKARRERPWSTSKQVRKPQDARKPSRSPKDATLGLPRSPSTSSSTSEKYRASCSRETRLTRGRFACKRCGDTCPTEQSVCSRCSVLVPGTPNTRDNLLGGMYDPFSTFPVEVDSRTGELIDHFLSVISAASIPIDVRQQSNLLRTGWFSTALTSSAFMHSLLCATAVHSYILGKGSYFSIEYHKAQAVSLINASLSDPELGLSDANIGAVFNLLCVEESLLLPVFRERSKHHQEEPNTRMLHLDGLKRMIALRGGLSSLRTNRSLQAFILWHSTAHSIASFYAPYVSPLPSPLQHGISHGFVKPLDQMTEACQQLGIDSTLLDIVADVSAVTADLDEFFSNELSQLDPVELQNQVCSLQSSLIFWVSDETHGKRSALEEALCVALVAFLARVLEVSDQSFEPLHFTATKKLQDALNRTICADWDPSPDILVWTLTIGGICAHGSSESEWFISQTSNVCVKRSVVIYDDFISRLRHLLWVDKRLGNGAGKLWESMFGLRNEQQLATATASDFPGPQDASHYPTLHQPLPMRGPFFNSHGPSQSHLTTCAKCGAVLPRSGNSPPNRSSTPSRSPSPTSWNTQARSFISSGGAGALIYPGILVSSQSSLPEQEPTVNLGAPGLPTSSFPSVAAAMSSRPIGMISIAAPLCHPCYLAAHHQDSWIQDQLYHGNIG